MSGTDTRPLKKIVRLGRSQIASKEGRRREEEGGRGVVSSYKNSFMLGCGASTACHWCT